jgi:hypothetical protein
MSHRSLANRAMRRWSRVRPKRAGSLDVDVQELISPLRYDVVVRAKFLSDLRERGFTHPTAELDEFALGHDYFTWFRYVETARFFPDLLTDDDLLLARYRQRVARALSTQQSYDRTGFDGRYPVTLGETPNGAVTNSGIRVTKRLHIKDGCHRLALVLIDGKELQPHMYRIGRVNEPVADNTATLLGRLHIDEAEYARFLSAGFSNEIHTRLFDLRCSVATEAPHRLVEFDDVVRVHQQARQVL